MWNESFIEHHKENPTCDGHLEVDLEAERQRGLCWIERLYCRKCSYTSKYHELFEGVRMGRRGPKTAGPNCAVQVALLQTPISNTSLNKILLASNLPAPSKTSMQRTGKLVQQVVKNTNIEDMNRHLHQSNTVNNARGEPRDTIAIETDGLFNNPLYSGVGKTLIQPSTQAVLLGAENVTGDRKVVSVVTRNKLCAVGSRTSNPCPDHDGICTANLALEENIGNEEAMAQECIEGILQHGIEVGELTTDGDSAAYRAAEQLYASGKMKCRPVHFLDTRHLSDNQRKKIKCTEFSPSFFTAATKKQKESLQARFALDLSKRCVAEFQTAMNVFSADITKVKRAMSYTTHCLVKCYQGDHRDCTKRSFVCKGTKSNNWVSRSTYMPKSFNCVTCTDSDEEKLHQCIIYRLSQAMIEKTKKNRNTQKVEAVNRSLRRSLPRNVTYPTSMEGRVHAAVHSVNNRPGSSIAKLCQKVGCSIKANTRVSRGLLRVNKDTDRSKNYNSSQKAKVQRVRKRIKMNYVYDNRPTSLRKEPYKKAMVEQAIADHTYSNCTYMKN